MAGRSPDDYRRASGYRRNSAMGAVRVGDPVMRDRVGPVQAWTSMDMDSPLLVDFLRDGRASTSGLVVNERAAIRNSTFFRSLNLIAGSIGMLPTHLMRRKANGEIEKAKDHPLFNVLWRKPNGYQTATQFKSYMQTCALLDGNAFALIIPGVRSKVSQLVPLKRRSVTPKLSDSWELTFEYRRPSGGVVTLQPEQVFHFRAPISLDGLRGVSLLDVAVDTLGLALKAQIAAGKLLSGGVMAGGALETDQTLGAEAIAQLKLSMEEQYAGADAAGTWMVLEEGLKAKPFIASAREAQFAEIRKQEAEEMSRFTDIPRPLLMFDETSWGSGIRELGLFLVTYCLLKWFVIWEEAIWLCLLTPAEQEVYYAKINEGALLRGSLKDQAEFFKAALGPNNGYLTQNEVREAFDRNPIEGGNELPRSGTTAAMVQKDDPDE